MVRYRHLTCTQLICLLTCLFLSPAFANKTSDETKLKKIKQDIIQLEKTIKGSGEKQGSLSSELKKSELASANINLQILDLEKKLKNLGKELKVLGGKKEGLEQARVSQQTLISQQMASAYRLGNEESIKLLLNQENPETISRTLKYYDYFLRARSERLTAYRQTLQSLEQVKTSIIDKQALLSKNRSSLKHQQQQLEQQQQQRRSVLAKLKQKITNSRQQLNKLNTERGKLESILKSLEQGIAKLSLPATDKPFKVRKGKLPWPVSGRLSKYFGSTRNANIRWNGWLLKAKEGTPVKAIHHGRIIFSDYLRGHGLLIIIDHGDGYMSLYAHNQVLLKETGEWVLPDEPIARVGNTGGQNDHALYFEIRYNGKPTNPKRWLAKKD